MSKFAWFLGGVLVGGLVTDYLNNEQRRKEKLIKKFKDCQNEGVHYENNNEQQQPQEPTQAPADEKINFDLSQEEIIRRQEIFKNSASNIAEAFNMAQQEEAPKAEPKAEEKVDPLNEQIEKAFGPGPKVKLDISGNFGI